MSDLLNLDDFHSFTENFCFSKNLCSTKLNSLAEAIFYLFCGLGLIDFYCHYFFFPITLIDFHSK